LKLSWLVSPFRFRRDVLTSITNRTDAWPGYFNITRAIGEVKKALLFRRF